MLLRFICKPFLTLIFSKPTPITQTTLFPLHPPTAALDRLTALLTSLRESLTVLSRMATERIIPTSPPVVAQLKISDGEIERLQSTIDALRVEIGMTSMHFFPRKLSNYCFRQRTQTVGGSRSGDPGTLCWHSRTARYGAGKGRR